MCSQKRRTVISNFQHTEANDAFLKVSEGLSNRGFSVVGHIAKDIHIKIYSCNSLPKVFTRLFKNSTPISKTNEILGEDWTFSKVLTVLKKHMVSPISYSYGGRGPNVAYGATILGATIELIGFVGEDFDRRYPGFYGGGYRTHLVNAGVVINELHLIPDKIHAIDEQKHKHGILAFKNKEIPTIYCVKDLKGNDFYFIDDIKGAHTLANACPIPKETLQQYDGIFVTSGEQPFNKRLINYAHKLNKEIIFDIGAYNLTDEYLQEIIPKCNVILGNRYEMNLAKQAFHINSMEELFDVSSDIFTIILEDKIALTAKIFERNKAPMRIGPIKVRKRVSSVGCCDGIAAGYLGLHAQGYDAITATKAGLIQCANIWQVEGVQEAMLSKKKLFQEMKNLQINPKTIP